MNEITQSYIDIVEKALLKYINTKECKEKVLYDSMKYSLLLKGKRIRPILMFEFCKLCGGKTEDIIPFACAIEMVHTYSLIHDDLPCMDDDDMRRGKLSNHVVYGEDIALLSGDALLTLAFEVMLEEKSVKSVGYEKASKAALVLAKSAGYNGMVAGQVIDLKNENKKVTIEDLIDMYSKKTGALIVAAAKMGCILAGADEEKIELSEKIAKNIGLSFQIVDDILDITADESELGKPIGSDVKNGKTTYVSIVGLEKAKEKVDNITEETLKLISMFSGNTEYLNSLVTLLRDRKK